ncbi:MAG TPA: autotransporter assembly complex family protein [Gammaproteobacteria bacterium]|nr:autotransporter assembly complex family protein [Gammaproteobacteria bacterium]
MHLAIHHARQLTVALLLWLVAFEAAAAVPISVEVKGISGALRENVLAHLSLAHHKDDSDLSEAGMRLLLRRAPKEVQTALRPFGYYEASVATSLKRTESKWLAEIDIKPGRQVRIDKVDVRVDGVGKSDPAFSTLVEKLPLKVGDSLNDAEYEKFKESLQNVAAERGYFDAKLTRHEIAVDPVRHRAEIYLYIDTGPRYLFGPVRFEQSQLDPDLLRRYVDFKQGEPFDSAKLVELQSALVDSDYFQLVTVSPKRDEAVDREVPIVITLTPRKPNKYTFGIGYGTDTGPRGSAGWERRWVNRRGHRVKLNAKVSQIGDSYTASYIVPMAHPRTDQLVYSAGYDDETTDTARSRITKYGVSYTHRRGSWTETWGLSYQQEAYTVGTDQGRSTLLVPSVLWSRVHADNRVYPRHGNSVSLLLRGAADSVLSDTSFTQTRLDAKLIGTAGDNARWIARTSLGYSWVPEFSTLPASMRFFAGGDRSVRGYGYNTLGPTDATGQVIGGDYLVVGSLEYEHTIRGRLGAAVFYDVGNALDDLSGPLERGAGVGLRWRSPVGPIRLDVASALSREGQPWRIHISIGPDL